MRIDGKKIAAEIYNDLIKKTTLLKEKGLNPHLVVILIGDDPASKTYVTQKEKWGGYIGAKITVLRYGLEIKQAELEKIIHDLNTDPFIHGLIIQRPLPIHIDQNKLLEIIDPNKDIDGFHSQSPFEVPVAQAVWRILEEVHKQEGTNEPNATKETEAKKTSGPSGSFDPSVSFLEWLHSKKIVVIGKGSTAGRPIINLLIEKSCQLTVVDRKTVNPDEVIRQADIVISAVGKEGVINENNIQKGSILIGVGILKDGNESLQGDYNEDVIKDIATAYTPTPGGVGPVNVAYLLSNLIEATK